MQPYDDSVPLLKSGQGREEIDTDRLFALVTGLVYGLMIGALGGGAVVWLVMR